MTLHLIGALFFWGVTAMTAVMLAGAMLNFFTAPRLEKNPYFHADAFTAAKASESAIAAPPSPSVSLLIPARNEEANLKILLPLLARLDYPDMEILILDDDSEDGTANLISQAASHVRLLRGHALPQGWLGKNWACAQLAQAARGEILIFCDADVRLGPEAVKATVARMQRDKLDALTALPRQIMGTWAEQAVLPVLLFLPVMGFAPIAWIAKTSMPALSLGCGQWFAFTRKAYDCLGGHASVRNTIVEDMALGRRVKESGLVLGAAISTEMVVTRMYTSFRTLWEGFSKNLAFLTGAGWLRPILFLFLFSSVNILPWLLPVFGFTSWLLPLALLAAARWITALAFREPPMGWLWSPVGALLIPAIAFRSWLGYRRHYVEWKGRSLAAAFVEAPTES